MYRAASGGGIKPMPKPAEYTPTGHLPARESFPYSIMANERFPFDFLHLVIVFSQRRALRRTHRDSHRGIDQKRPTQRLRAATRSSSQWHNSQLTDWREPMQLASNEVLLVSGAARLGHCLLAHNRRAASTVAIRATHRRALFADKLL